MTFGEFVFQSPIYGSRTKLLFLVTNMPGGFNPLSTGHARFSACRTAALAAGFNPLSTGHARTAALVAVAVFVCFNPLSTGHARGEG